MSAAKELIVQVSASSEMRIERTLAFLERFRPGDEVLVVGPSRGAMDDLVRRLTRKRGASFGLHRKTLGSWAADLATPRLAHRGLTLATPLALSASAITALRRGLSESRLHYFSIDRGSGPATSLPSFPRVLLTTLLDLRREGILPEAMSTATPRLTDLRELLALFLEELELRHLADPAMVREEATLAARDLMVARAPIAFHDAPIAGALDARLVEALIEESASAHAVVPRGDERALFALTQAGVKLDWIDPEPVSALERARKFVFDPAMPTRGDWDATLSLESAPSIAQEATEVARRILHDHAEKASNGDGERADPRFDETAIVVPSKSAYRAHIESALLRAGIPAWFSFGTRKPHPSGRAFIALLACRLEHFSARRFSEYLSLGQLPDAPNVEVASAFRPPVDESLGRMSTPSAALAEEDDEEPLDQTPTEGAPAPRFGGVRTPRRWASFVGEAILSARPEDSGEAYYARRLASLKVDRERTIAALDREDPGSSQLSFLKQEVEDIDSFMAFVLPLMRLLDGLPEAADFKRWISRLELLAGASLKKPALTLAVLDELRSLEGTGEVTLGELVETLRERLTEVEQPPPKSRFGRVFVATPRELRGRSFRSVHVLGLTERVFPARNREDPLLYDADRQALSPGLATRDHSASAERLSLLLALGAAREKVVLSYPRVDVEVGRPRVPSFYALDVARGALGELPAVDEMQRQAAEKNRIRLNWPAPEDPARSIDVIERDLASLRRLLQSPPRTVKGRARYLLEESPRLGRALRSRYSRFDLVKLGIHDGLLVTSPYVRQFLGERSLTQRAYSPSALQHFSACPLRFYLAAILGAAPRAEKEQTETLDARARGDLFHRTIALLVHRLRGLGLLPIPADQVTNATGVLQQIFAEEVARTQDQIEPKVLHLFEEECRATLADLESLLTRELCENSSFVPKNADLSFGLHTHEHLDPESAEEPVRIARNYLLRGAIDSIEKGPGIALRVTDYKTGQAKQAGPLVIGKGEVLQPVLYGLAAEVLLRRGGDHQSKIESSRLFYATRRGEFTERTVLLDQDAKDRAIRVLDLVEGSIQSGFLPAWPREEACKYCDFRPACGPDEQKRITRKEPADQQTGELLQDLRVVRQQP